MTLVSLPDWLAGSPLSGRLPLRTLCLALLLWLLPTCVMAAPGSIRACMENSDSPPWLLMSGEGIVQFHLKEVANRIGHPIILTPLPWKRCLSLVSQGQLDAAVKLSYSEERARTIGVYPMRHGAPDPAKRLLTESYSLYQPKGGQVRWDGRQLVAHGVVAAQSGFSIVAQLQESGVRVDDSSREPLILLKKVAMQRAVAAALQTGVAERTLAAHPQLQATLERITPPLVEKPYYLIFSHPFHQAHPDLSQQVWDEIEEVRHSAAYARFVTGMASPGTP
ncbi:substrate-binding periplasmic protein [Aeromonas caviae]|uniref:substrate-binding periplasmic protein n=2 Tax=Aeromonas TaxID=642 RepID=UPI002B462B15|nr:transporter substrate-binding domain-containing protein [Aeromonas caviae]